MLRVFARKVEDLDRADIPKFESLMASKGTVMGRLPLNEDPIGVHSRAPLDVVGLYRASLRVDRSQGWAYLYQFS